MNRLVATLFVLGPIACGPAPPEGQFHETLCDIPFINEDFLTGGMDRDWRERTEGSGSFSVESAGSGASKVGWLVLSGSAGGLSETDRSAYGLVHVAPSQDYRLRMRVTDAPTAAGVFSGLVLEQDRDNLVAFGLRGDGSSARPELLGLEAGATAFRAEGEPVDPGSVLLVLIRYRDEFVAALETDEAEVGRGELALSRGSTEAGMVVGPSASVRIEWIEGCPYYHYGP